MTVQTSKDGRPRPIALEKVDLLASGAKHSKPAISFHSSRYLFCVTTLYKGVKRLIDKARCERDELAVAAQGLPSIVLAMSVRQVGCRKERIGYSSSSLHLLGQCLLPHRDTRRKSSETE